MGLKLTTRPTVEPAQAMGGLNNIKRHIREALDIADEDTLINDYVNAAWRYCEQQTWRQFLTASYTLALPRFSQAIVLPKPPFVSVTSIKYYDDNNAQQTLNADIYEASSFHEPAMLCPGYSQSWPSTFSRQDAVLIEYVAGYGTMEADMPVDLLHAVRLLVADMFENRELQLHSNPHTTADMFLEGLTCHDERIAEFV